MKLGFILCIVLLLHTSNTNSLANEIENRGFIVDFDYKCMLCKWTAQLLIKYHGEGFKPERLFFLISKLCTFFGHMDSVSWLKNRCNINQVDFFSRNRCGENLLKIRENLLSIIFPQFHKLNNKSFNKFKCPTYLPIFPHSLWALKNLKCWNYQRQLGRYLAPHLIYLHLVVVGEFVVVSHLKIFPLQLLGQPISQWPAQAALREKSHLK